MTKIAAQPAPQGTTHTLGQKNGGLVHFKVVGVHRNGNALVSKWIKTRQSWSKPQEYINW